MPDDPGPQAAATGAIDQAQRFRDATEKIRQRTELTAKTLGGLGTAAISALGIAKFADVFPWAPGQGRWVFLLVTSFLAMIGVVGLFAWRLWHASERILFRSDVERMSDLDEEERKTVREVYRETATLNLAPTLRSFEARAQRLYRIAARIDDENLAAKLIQRAGEIAADIRSVQARAGMLVVRRRAAQVFRDWLAIAAFILLALAVVGFGIAADRLDSERTALTKLVKDCAEAKEAAQVGGIRDLPEICKGSSAAVPAPEAEARATQCCLVPNQVDLSATPAKGTAQKAAAANEALHAAANLATTLIALGGTGPASAAGEGPEILRDFLRQVGFPLTEAGISAVSRTLWKRFAIDDPPRLPPKSGQAAGSQPINLTVVLRDRRSPIQVFGTSPPISAWPVFGKADAIRLTVVVRERRPRTRIIRIPPFPG